MTPIAFFQLGSGAAELHADDDCSGSQTLSHGQLCHCNLTVHVWEHRHYCCCGSATPEWAYLRHSSPLLHCRSKTLLFLASAKRNKFRFLPAARKAKIRIVPAPIARGSNKASIAGTINKAHSQRSACAAVYDGKRMNWLPSSSQFPWDQGPACNQHSFAGVSATGSSR